MSVQLKNLKVIVSENLYLSDPESSRLGKKIIFYSVEMIDDIGFEKFTFKKLGLLIDSPEASIYRYFRNKNQLLTYLISWYWGWMEYRLVIETTNILSPEKRLEKSLNLITSNTNEILNLEGVSIKKLQRIIISESAKSYLTKDVDKANNEGAYLNFKQFVLRISDIILEVNPKYKYPQMLLTTIIEGAHLQVFFAEHLPRLTNKQKSSDYITTFYTNLAIQSIKSDK
jgi:AcrR family transcriptional regulator